jgi:predicted outer membrane repeat protein
VNTFARMSMGVLLLAAIGSASAATIRVPQDLPSISWAVGVAASGDEIVIAPGTYSEWSIGCTGKNLTIRGAAASADSVIMDAHQQSTHIWFTNSQSRIENITFINGANSDGAVRVNDNCRLELVRCRFLNNSHRVGGGLYVGPVQAVAYVDNVIFENNHASLYGGGIGCDGQLYLNNCVFTGNSASELGGAMYLLSTGPSYIYTSTISGNSAPQGGGLYYGGVVNILHSAFSQNTATTGAGYRGTPGSRLFASYTSFDDPSYFCAGFDPILDCCAAPAWICGQIDNSACDPEPVEEETWGSVKALYR